MQISVNSWPLYSSKQIPADNCTCWGLLYFFFDMVFAGKHELIWTTSVLPECGGFWGSSSRCSLLQC